MDAPPLSRVLRDLDQAGARRVPLGTVIAATGSRLHGVALLLLALPDALPLPIPSTSTVLGLPLVAIAAHLVAFGEGSRLPARIERIEIPHGVLHALARYAAPVLEVLERLGRPRLAFMLRSERAIGIVCLYLALVLLLPIPFLNTPPALCLATLALGLIRRDGVIVAIGLAATVALTASLTFLAEWIETLLARLV